MQPLEFTLEKSQPVVLHTCNNSIIFTLDIVDNNSDIMSLTVLNIASKNTRTVSKAQAKVQIASALKDFKRGVVKF